MLDSILGLVTPEMKQALSTRFGEPPSTIQNGLGIATGATLGSLASKASDLGFMDKIVQMAGSAGSQNLLGALPSIASGGPTGAIGDLVSRFLPMVFGSQQGAITNMIAQRAGMSGGSGIGLLKMAVPLILGYFGKLHAAGSLTPATLGSMLKAEAPSLSGYVPADALHGAPGVIHDTAARTAEAVETGARQATGSRWLWAAAIAGIALLAFLVMRPHTRQVAANQATGPAMASLGRFTVISLPQGTQINVPANGVEARLVKYLQDPSAPVGDVIWFDFDRLTFNTGKATLEPASDEQLNNVAVILKAYPTAKIRLGGYTDNTGDSEENQHLSEERAQNVMAALTARGIDASRLSAKGYGEENPVADNSTAEGRQKNRRISIRVAEK
jgi:outer membrane protein OmpA-like peptidoglycan-associated protein